MRAASRKTLPDVQFLSVDQLQPNPWNRKQFDPEALKELAKSIRAEGIREPLLVRPLNGGQREKRSTGTSARGSSIRESTRGSSRLPPHAFTAAQPSYQIASGNRRWLAAQKVGLKKVPCLIEPLSDEQVAEDNITMNIQREDIPPLELSRMVQDYLTRFGKTQVEASRAFGKSKAWVSELLQFTKMVPPGALKKFNALNLSWGVLRQIRSLPTDIALLLANEVEENALTARGVAKRCRQFLYGSHSKGGIQAPEPDPIRKEWEKVHEKMAAASTVLWDVRYVRQSVSGGSRELGWQLFVKPQEDVSAGALAEWFEQMAKALRGKKPEDARVREVKAIRRAETKLINDLNPRLPRTPAETKELTAIAVRGTPQDVYRWIYGPDSAMVQAVPFATWKESGMAPEEGLKTILEGIRSIKG